MHQRDFIKKVRGLPWSPQPCCLWRRRYDKRTPVFSTSVERGWDGVFVPENICLQGPRCSRKC